MSDTTGIALMQHVKSIRDIDIVNKRILIRADFNVPMDNDHNISNDIRIKEALPSINYCLDNGAKSIVLVSHLGRPKERDDSFSLKHITKRLEALLGKSIAFAPSIESAKDLLSKEKSNTDIILLENIRFYKGETKNDENLSKDLASLCDIYINDAFGTSHRAHASTHGIARFTQTKVAGFLLKKEIDFFARIIKDPVRPLLLIVGGSKVSSKLTLLNKLLDIVDKVIVGGAMSNTFLKSLGYDTQKGLVEDDLINEAHNILENAKNRGVKFYLPVDLVSTDNISNPQDIRITPSQDIPKDFIAVDIGPASIKLFNEVISECSSVVWNGPLGIYEHRRFSKGTFSIANALANSHAFSLIGGGDTADALDKSGYKEDIDFISTGGGASLELLEGKVLPAFEVLDKKS